MRTGQTFEINTGESATFSVLVKTRNPAGQSIPVDLSGKQLFLYVKRNEQDLDNESYIIKSTGSGITHTDAAAGRAEIAFETTDTSGLLPENVTLVFRWSLRLVDGTDVRFISEGSLVVSPA